MRKLLLSLSLLSSITAAQAQHYMGLATSNWSGTNSMYLNPANIADSRTKFSIDLFSANVYADNDLSKINFSKAYKFATSLDNNNNGSKLGDVFDFNNAKTNFSMHMPSAEVRLPGVMISINHKHSIALTTRVRGFNQMDNFSQSLFRNLVDSTYSPTSGSTFQSDHFNYTTHIWSELGLSYAGVIYEKGKHQVKGGLTLRYLMGAYYITMHGEHLDGTYTYTGTDAMLAVGNTDFHYAHKGSFDNINGFGDALSYFGNSAGKGVGGDIGFTYEFRPNPDKYYYDMDGREHILDNSRNKYLIRVSAAVTDIGSITYNNSSSINFVHASSTPAVIKGSEIADKINDYAALTTYLTAHHISADSGSASNKVKLHLPTALRLGADYHAYKGLYVNAMFIGNLDSRSNPGNSYYGQIIITPRWDTRVWSVGVPVTYNMLEKAINLGTAVRVGGFFVGSDNLTGLISKSSYGGNVYFGAYVPFNKKRPKDSDHDLVSNKRDKCPNEKGTWEMKGCPNPDKDGDGILDKYDKCPDVAGSKTAMGCPDADLDSVSDAEDRCPEEAGMVALQGCPDRDHDGIADKDDACPDQPGLAQYAGCPDTDHDGIPDNLDACPDKAGPKANQGCPDTDNDGVPDNKDKCPTVPGTKANQGCPEVNVEVKKRLAFAATAIEFQTGKAILKKTSYKLLDEIVRMLNDYPDYIMTIEGHTDNVGKPEANRKLSLERANAVKNYFVSKGISDERLMTNGYGDTKPVASNKTAAGRAKNRRVVMDLKLKD